MIDACPSSDLKDPGADAPMISQVLELRDRFQKSLLHDILGVLTIGCVGKAYRQYSSTMHPEEIRRGQRVGWVAWATACSRAFLLHVVVLF